MAQPWLIGGVGFVATVAAGMLLYPTERNPPKPAAAAPASGDAAGAAGDKITIPTLGLSVVRPSSWRTITAEENAQNLRSVTMDDRQLQELAARYATAPIIAFAKYGEPYEDLNPSFKINVRSLGSFAGHSPEDILLAALPTMRRMFGDLTIEAAPTRTTVSGKPAAYTRFAYTLRAGEKAFPAISEIWVVPSGPVFFMIGTGTRADERNGSRAEARKIVDIIRLD
jgi:hypothetical protein